MRDHIQRGLLAVGPPERAKLPHWSIDHCERPEWKLLRMSTWMEVQEDLHAVAAPGFLPTFHPGLTFFPAIAAAIQSAVS